MQCIRTWFVIIGATLLCGCALEPPGTDAERARAVAAGAPYTQPFEKRDLPGVPDQPNWTDLLHRAFYANGDLEAAYHDWKAALARIDIAAGYPNSNFSPSFSYLFSGGTMKGWDRTTVGVGFDPSVPLQWPAKVKQAAKIALDDARDKGERFRAAKFALQRKVLTAWLDYALTAEKVRIQDENLDLLKMLEDTAAGRVRAGAPQQDLLKAQTAFELAQSEQANLRAELSTMRAMLNGMLARTPEAPLAPPNELPVARPLVADDARLIAVAAQNNPELAALAHDVAGRSDALELARMAYIPDFSPQFSINGTVQQMLGTMVMLPTNLRKIRGAINEAQSMLQGTQALARQKRTDQAAQIVATLYALRNDERQVVLFRDVVGPRVRDVLSSSARAYATGTAPFADLIDSQRSLLDIRLMSAEAAVAREKRLAELEELLGTDAETLGESPTTAPATQADAPQGIR